MMGDHMETFVRELISKTSKNEIDWKPLATFEQYDSLVREMRDLYSADISFSFDSFVDCASYFFTHGDGYIVLCDMNIIERATSVPYERLILLTRVNPYIPLQKSPDSSSFRDILGELKSAIEFNIYDKYELPSVYYSFWDDIINN